MFTYNRLSPDKLKGDLEDCLTLNIFTKKVCVWYKLIFSNQINIKYPIICQLNAKQPVMFYVHGGSLQVGFASDHRPDYLLEEDIVLVVIQYRLGILGFSGTKTPEMSGNFGLMDIILALQWVQEHISAFGGDSSKVTVFGESSGGELGGALLISPKTPPSVFHRLIIQSGSILDRLATNMEPLAQVERVCRALKCEHCERIDRGQQCLKRAPVMDILKAAESVTIPPFRSESSFLLFHIITFLFLLLRNAMACLLATIMAQYPNTRSDLLSKQIRMCR